MRSISINALWINCYKDESGPAQGSVSLLGEDVVSASLGLRCFYGCGEMRCGKVLDIWRCGKELFLCAEFCLF